MLLHHYYSLLHCNNLLSFTYYSSLSHIIAYYCKMLLFLTLVSSCLDRSKGQHTRNNGNPRWWCAWARSQNLKPTTGRLGDDSESFKLTRMFTKAWGRSPQQSWNHWTWPRGAVLARARLSVQLTQTTAEIIVTSVAIMITMPPAVPDRARILGLNLESTLAEQEQGWLYIQVSVWGLFVLTWSCN